MARKSNGEPKSFPNEEFMAKARKEGRVRNEELSMRKRHEPTTRASRTGVEP